MGGARRRLKSRRMTRRVGFSAFGAAFGHFTTIQYRRGGNRIGRSTILAGLTRTRDPWGMRVPETKGEAGPADMLREVVLFQRFQRFQKHCAQHGLAKSVLSSCLTSECKFTRIKSVLSTGKTCAQHGLHTIKSVLSTKKPVKHELNTDLAAVNS